MQELNVKLKQLPVWELATYLGELEAGRPSESLAPLVGSKPQNEDRGDVDEDGYHLYNSSPFPCLEHEFSYPLQSCLVTNMAPLPDSSFSEHEGPPPPEWEASAGTGGESWNPGGYLH